MHKKVPNCLIQLVENGSKNKSVFFSLTFIRRFSITSRTFASSVPSFLTSFISSRTISSSVFPLLHLLLSSRPCYTAQCINCGLKNSQLRLGGIVEANGSELQGVKSDSEKLDSLQNPSGFLH